MTDTKRISAAVGRAWAQIRSVSAMVEASPIVEIEREAKRQEDRRALEKVKRYVAELKSMTQEERDEYRRQESERGFEEWKRKRNKRKSGRSGGKPAWPQTPNSHFGNGRKKNF